MLCRNWETGEIFTSWEMFQRHFATGDLNKLEGDSCADR